MFVVYFAGENAFALLEYKDIQFNAGTINFQEEGQIPDDPKVVGRTRAKVNRMGPGSSIQGQLRDSNCSVRQADLWFNDWPE